MIVLLIVNLRDFKLNCYCTMTFTMINIFYQDYSFITLIIKCNLWREIDAYTKAYIKLKTFTIFIIKQSNHL